MRSAQWNPVLASQFRILRFQLEDVSHFLAEIILNPLTVPDIVRAASALNPASIIEDCHTVIIN